MFYKAAVLSFLMLSNMVQAICPELDNLPRPDNNLVPKLAWGSDVDRNTLKQVACLNTTENFIGTSTATINSRVISSFNDIFEQFVVKGEANASYFVFTAKANASYEKVFRETQFSQSFVLEYDVSFGTADATLDSVNPLNATGLRYRNDACGFKRYCGNQYVCQTTKGANISVKMDFDFTSEYHKNEFKAGASLGIANLKICCKPFSGGFSAEVSKLSETTRKNGTLRIEAIQKGGNVEQLGRILGGTVFSCSLDNLAACTAALDGVANYVASDDFITGVRENPTVTDYKNCPYEYIPDVPSLPNEVTPEIEALRVKLSNTYKELLADRQNALNLLNLSLSTARQQQIKDLSVALEMEAESIRQIGELCWNDLSNCSQKAHQALLNLQAYDKNVLLPNPADGLVAYYPFNANALDESGKGNDGVMYGVTPIEDRFNNKNSAFSFDGSTSYIRVNSKPELSGFNDMSISVWIYKDSLKPISSNLENIESIVTKWFFNCPNSTNPINQDTYALALGSNNTIAGATNRYCNTDVPNTPTVLTTNKWVNTIFSHSSNGGGKLYINGKLVSYDSRGGSIVQSTNPLIIGADNKQGNLWRFFNGSIDDIRIYNRALTDAEIKQLYETTETKINQPPVAIFSSSNSNPSTVNVDASSSNDPDGTIQRYEWLSSDGQMKSGKTATFTFEKAGDYAITLTVTDDKGATSQSVKNIYIQGNNALASCTNSTITNCQASFSLETGQLCVPCVSVPTPLGSQIYAVELTQLNPLQLGFELNPLTLKPHNFKDSCLATYTGILNVPCTKVGTTTYNVDFTQRSNSLIFDVYDAR
ncbi:LamG-like jellyroll fold domain-containing protein [Beggiatoa leptomitoformis]|uniref:PKD domain-containing protein n=1 Tax=Beggiatoa leptomitoformis TaxID=288004 RepID=A0A2N9YFY3_9GAMM|nr:LamG-like jellyroll fold domain-containing protein [Beggiatoa leptomitoformis]ALG68277.1 PKD domain-containing protein [Beggiatoa leptomitoformis]AUI69412.1 PKD domain-containing protein [Beggiatoa leptomitoformis]